MSYQEFLAKVKPLDVCVENYVVYHHKTKYAATGDYLKESWLTGGQCGGSCWDTGDEDPHESVSAVKEPELVDLFTVLEAFVPELSFLKARKLMDLIKYDAYTKSEYYGNYYTYGVKYVDLKELYEALNEMGAL
jgi:hypothetical protein